MVTLIINHVEEPGLNSDAYFLHITEKEQHFCNIVMQENCEIHRKISETWPNELSIYYFDLITDNNWFHQQNFPKYTNFLITSCK